MKNRGRPKEVDGGKRCSILFGRQELRILAKAGQNQLNHQDSSSRSRVVRQMVRFAWAEHRDDLQELWKKELAVQELERRLEQERKARKQAEDEAHRARSKAKARESVMQRLLMHLPLARRKAAVGLPTPSGIPLLDQVWHNSGQSWARVVARLEETQRQLESPSPAPPPPKPDDQSEVKP